MLTIRRAQLSVFEQDSMARFEAALMQHLRQAWPRECRLLGGAEREAATVRQCLRIARALGARSERELTLAVKLMISLGAGFSNDPQLPWAATALGNLGLPSLTQRLEGLYDDMVEHLGLIGGADAEWAVRALLRIQSHAFVQAPDSDGPALVDDLCELLEGFWPEKFAQQEYGATAALVRAALHQAHGHGLHAAPARACYVTAAYVLGHEFDTDPWHPWASRALGGTDAVSEARDAQFVAQSLARLRASLEAQT